MERTRLKLKNGKHCQCWMPDVCKANKSCAGWLFPLADQPDALPFDEPAERECCMRDWMEREPMCDDCPDTDMVDNAMREEARKECIRQAENTVLWGMIELLKARGETYHDIARRLMD